MEIARALFRWPDGIVVGNLIASAMWATPALIHLHRKLDRNHAAIVKGRVSGNASHLEGPEDETGNGT